MHRSLSRILILVGFLVLNCDGSKGIQSRSAPPVPNATSANLDPQGSAGRPGPQRAMRPKDSDGSGGSQMLGGARAAPPTRSVEVQQPGTDLFWRRCPVGQKWTGSSCDGVSREMKWAEAQKSCPAGYRLPMRDEYTALLGGCDDDVRADEHGYCNPCYKSITCSSVFSSAQDWYWSSSSHADGPVVAWSVSFYNGLVTANYRSESCFVLCVRLKP